MPRKEGRVTMPDGVRLYYRTVPGPSGAPRSQRPPSARLLRAASSASRRTLVFYDVRNRGRSQTVTDPARLQGGLHQDADDLEAVRRHLGMQEVDVLAHSYEADAVLTRPGARATPSRAGVPRGPGGRCRGQVYPAHLTGADETLGATLAPLGELQKKERGSADRRELCRKFWSVLRVIYVTDAADAHRMRLGPLRPAGRAERDAVLERPPPPVVAGAGSRRRRRLSRGRRRDC